MARQWMHVSARACKYTHTYNAQKDPKHNVPGPIYEWAEALKLSRNVIPSMPR